MRRQFMTHSIKVSNKHGRWGNMRKEITELIKELKHKDSSVRRNAAETLGMIGDEKAVDSLILILKDKNRFVRQEAIAALGKIGGARLVGPVTQALKEEKDEFVKESIKKVLEKLEK
jgi:HEAT repeat protein